MRFFLMAAGLVLTVSGTAQAGCVDAPDACEIENGTYHIEVPADATGPVPAIMFAHGWGGSGEGTLRNRGMVDAILGHGYAVIAPDGMPREGRNGRGWIYRQDHDARRDDVAFLNAVRLDAGRFGVDPDQVLLGGFSSGGSMVSYAACRAPDNFAAFVPVSGSFWRPHPESCNGPVRLLHTHGWTDTTVPLEGRAVRGESALDPNAVVQGDVFHAMEIWRQTNGCIHFRADDFAMDDDFWRRKWDRCTEGAALELAVFPGGHAIPRGWASLAINWFEAN